MKNSGYFLGFFAVLVGLAVGGWFGLDGRLAAVEAALERLPVEQPSD